MSGRVPMWVRWNDVKRKIFTRYPADIQEKFWVKTREIINKIQNDELILDWSIHVVDNQLFINRAKNKWYMLCPETKIVWLATSYDKSHLVDSVVIPKWEMAELLDVFIWLLGQPERLKQIKQ